MPVHECSLGGKSGYQWGESGRCYTYAAGDEAGRKRAKRRAHIQGYAAEQHGAKALADFRPEDAELWRELRGIILPRVVPLFQQAFLVGAELGARQKPVTTEAPSDAEWLEGIRDIDPREQTPVPYDFEGINAASQEVIAGYTDSWWEQFEAGTQRQMRTIIANAERFGFTIDQVILQMEPLFGPVRAQRIAVSEITNLLGMGAQETYRRAGYGQWIWRTVRDSRVDPICRARDRRRFPISTPFRRAHVNCRCWPVPAGRPTVNRILAA